MRNAASRFADSTHGGGSCHATAGRSRPTRLLLALLIPFAMTLAFASAADAELGVLGSSGSGGGLFDVNWNGTGGASPGDRYAGGSDSSQVSATGEVKRRWGLDVVETGPDNADETQSVRVQATGGTFTLTYGGETTEPIAYNASASTVQSELNALLSIGGVGGSVTVIEGPGDATGSTPYLVSFGGVQGGANQPLIEPDDSLLTGPNANAFVATTNPGGTGFEICEPDAGDVCKAAEDGIGADAVLGGGVGENGTLAVDQSSGDLYLGNAKHGVNKYSATGELLGAFGYDVVSIGPHDSAVDQKERLIVRATGGTFTVSKFFPGVGEQTSAPIPFNASSAVVEEKINKMPRMEEVRAKVSVTGGPGNATGSSPYVLTFQGTIAGDSESEFEADNTGLEGEPKVAAMKLLQKGGALEVCTPSDACKRIDSSTGQVGSLGSGAPNLTVVPPGAPNAGNVLVSGGNRVNEFTGDGGFVRMFGWDVVSQGVDDSSVNEQQQVTIKASAGKFSLVIGKTDFNPGTTTGAIGIGNLLNGSETVTNLQTDRSGNFGGQATRISGSFAVGEEITGNGIPPGTTITEVTPISLKLSNPATATASNQMLAANDLDFDATPAEVKEAVEALPEIGGVGGTVTVTGGPGDPSGSNPYTITFGGTLGGDDVPQLSASPRNLTSTTTITATGATGGVVQSFINDGTGGSGYASIPYNATAGTVQSLLEGQAVIGPGNVSVSGPAGGPWQITLAGALAGTTFGIAAESFFLTGPSPVVTVSTPAAVTTSASGGAFEACIAAEGDLCKEGAPGSAVGQFLQDPDAIAADATGAIYTVESGEPPGGGGSRNRRVQKFTPSGAPPYLEPSVFGYNERQDVTVKATAGQFKVAAYENSPQTTGDLSATASPAELETALNGLSAINKGGGSVSVTGGPGDATGTSPYHITFGGGPRAGTDIATLIVSQGTTPLSGGTGAGANTVTVKTVSDGGPKGAGNNDTPRGVAIMPNGDVMIAKEYAAGAAVCEDGTRSVSETRLQRVSSAGTTLLDTSKPCAVSPSDTEDGLRVDPNTSLAYQGGFIFGDVGTAPDLTLNPPSNLSANGVTISGDVDPNVPPPSGAVNLAPTRYRVEYRLVGAPSWEAFTTDIPVGAGDSAIPFSVGISTLEPTEEYEARVIVTKPFGFKQVVAVTPPFTTPATRPKIETLSSSNLTATSVDLSATINPQGADTTYRFEYGKTPEYGQSTPELNIGEVATPVAVERHVAGLEPGFVYHFRVVATNSEGVSPSTDQTFNFYPEPCPNRTVRQQTGSGGLPDCRAYELVSPGNAGAAALFPGGGPPASYAVDPARLTFRSEVTAIPGPWNSANRFDDRYVATRSSTGWTTQYIGGESNEFELVGQPLVPSSEILADRGLNQFAEWRSSADPYMAPYLKNSDGDFAGRLPTNLAEVPGADLPNGFAGDVKPSGDFSHYFFSSANLAFAPGGLTSGNGSVYDNDVANKTVVIASKTPGGANIPREPADKADGFLQLPGASVDGSHILISAPEKGLCGATKCGEVSKACIDPKKNFEVFQSCFLRPGHLYMRVDASVTYDVSQGRSVQYEGMTDDGTRVFFTSAAKLTADDHDTSTDLYMWSEATDSLSRLSSGAGSVGDTDACTASWTTACGVQVVPKAPTNFEAKIQTDNAIATDDGSVYFYSPEQLVGSDGVPGRRNLYVTRDGDVHYVSTLDDDKPITRIQVSPSGDFAAFLTRSKLTAYPNEASDGICAEDALGPISGPSCTEMYLYDVDANSLVCASCDQTGTPPSNDVEASRNGIFLTEDGRAFFATKDPLLARDTNGTTDVYEYVESRTRLITSGIGGSAEGKTFTGVGAGLVGVSNDGVNVYFFTHETLVLSDENGSQVKFYDARTNGGFAIKTPVAPCAAADECHGPGTAATAPPLVTSSAALGSGGNLKLKKKHGKKKRHHKKHGRHNGRAAR